MVSGQMRIRSRRLFGAFAGAFIVALSPWVPSPAGATVSFVVTELSGCGGVPAGRWDCLGQFPGPGTRVTIGIRMTSSPDDEVFGLGGSVGGYGENVVEFHSGEAVPSVFHAFADPAIGVFDGIPNLAAPTLSESSFRGQRIVNFMTGVRLGPSSAEHPLDPGLDGVIGGGDAQFRVRFDVVGFGPIQFRIGSVPDGGGAFGAGGTPLPFNGALIEASSLEDGFVIVQTPEPSGLLLVGLGLVGLASFGRGCSTNGGEGGI